jgi:muramoyltetrapeptide carboxypeptidase
MLSRRTALQALGAAALLPMAIPAAAQAATRKPPRLRPGDTVGLIQPAGFIADPFELQFAVETIRAMGLVPKLGRHLNARHGYLAGTDAERAADVNAMFADREVRAIFAARGGWGCARILPHLDWRSIRSNPKLLVGFSDITALHLAIAAKAGFATIHGPNAGASWGRLSWDAFRAIAFDGATPTIQNPPGTSEQLIQRSGRIQTHRAGRASGRLLGGNLTVLTGLIGTAYLPSFDGAILFLEDVEEAEYRVDRMLTQLALGGTLARVAGVVFGQCTRCTGTGPSYGGFTLSEVLGQHLSQLGIPAFSGALFGHISDQFSLPIGIRAEIDAEAGTIQMLEPAVA